MKSKTLGLIAFVAMFLSAICWGLNLLNLNLGSFQSALDTIVNVCCLVVMLIAAYPWVKTQKKGWKIVYLVIAVLAILTAVGVGVGFKI